METKLSNQRIFEILYRDKIFFKYYLDNYFNRLSITNKDFIKEIFLEFNTKKEIYPADLLNLANTINGQDNKSGYRNVGITSSYEIVKPNQINTKLYRVLDSYRTLWKILDNLEKESFLHIHLMRIYPFINNNELICHLVLISNLINSYYPPVILDESYKEEYYRVIDAGDALKFKIYLENKIEEEIQVMIDLYKKYYLFPENISIEEIILKKSNY
ncbi:MAG: hypothetical protein PHF21_04320 [Bacilli bacterium]|nr:hypothetical protein [Bacilli bacterium]